MKKKCAFGFLITFLLGFIFSKSMPIQTGIGEHIEKQMLIEVIFIFTTLIYYLVILWKYMLHRIWLKIVLILCMLLFSLIFGYVFTGFVIQPIMTSNNFSFVLLAKHEPNIVWYWSFGFSIVLFLLLGLKQLFFKIIRGETVLF